MNLTDLSAALSNSLSLTSILILTALGLAITFGVMRVINMAHGQMLMLGAYTAVVVTDPNYLNLSLYVAIPVAFVVVGFVGFLMEIFLIRFLYGRPLDTLLATWGAGMIIQQVINLSLGSRQEYLQWPEFLRNNNFQFTGVTVPYFRLFIVVVTGVCLLGVYLLFYWTSFGLKVRAVVQNRNMAAAMGISTRLVDSLSFALATGLAGVAGCILGTAYAVEPTMGDKYIVESFMVVILGGMGQLLGTIGGGVLYGTSLSVVEKVQGNTTIAQAIILFAVVVFLLFRPSGLFVTKERSYDS